MLVICALLLAHTALAQHEPKDDEGLDAMLTPMYGEACGYQSCLPIKPGWLNVHIVPQTHSELGHMFNFEQHFTGEEKPYIPTVLSMKRILNAVVTQLWEDERRKFTLSDTAYLFHWWSKIHPTVHRMVYELIRQGRLTFVGGGLSISDEASTSYHAIIDQFTYSLRKLNATFRACARPLVAWAVDVYGHSREFTSLMAQMGYDALFINPISYDDEAARLVRKALEFVWRGSDDLGAATDIFAHDLFDGYWSPPGFCFSKLCSDPLLVTSSNTFSNVRERIDKFIETVINRQAPHYETRNIMVIMGHRKAYFDADVWFANIEKLISFTNWRAAQKGLNVTLFYSNPPCYLLAVHDENPELETKQDDFFPYVHDKDSYTVGMYTSRPNLKYLIREAHIYLQILKQMHVTANMRDDAILDEFNWIMGVVQDHSIATGVLRSPVKQYYVTRLDDVIVRSTTSMSYAFSKLRESPVNVTYNRCLFNMSSCEHTRYIKHSIQVYNPLGWPVTMPIRLPIQPMNSKYHVYDSNGSEVPSETIKLPDSILDLKHSTAADHELVFIANNLPPVGYRSYYIEAQYHRAKRNVLKILDNSKTKNALNMEEEDNQDVEDTNKKTAQTVSEGTKETRATQTRRSRKKNGMKVLGTDIEKAATTKDLVVPEFNVQMKEKIGIGKNRNLTKVPRKAADDLKDPERETKEVIQQEVKDKSPESTTEAELIMLPMLRDYLNRENILRKINFVDTDSEFKSDDFLDETTTDYEPGADIAKPERRNEDPEPTRVPELMPARTEPELDIMVPIKRRTTKRPDIKIDIKTYTDINKDIEVPIKHAELVTKPVPSTAGLYIIPLRTTTDSDIRVPTVESDIRVPYTEHDIRVPLQRTNDVKIPIRAKATKPVRGKAIQAQSADKEFSSPLTPVRVSEEQPIRTISTINPSTKEWFAIVPVRTSTEPIATISAYTTESMLIADKGATTETTLTLTDEPAEATTDMLTISTSTEHDIIEEEQNDEEWTTTTEKEIETQTEAEVTTSTQKTLEHKTEGLDSRKSGYKTEERDSDALIDTDNIVSEEVIDKESINKPKFRAGHDDDISSTTIAVTEATEKIALSTTTAAIRQRIDVNKSTEAEATRKRIDDVVKSIEEEARRRIDDVDKSSDPVKYIKLNPETTVPPQITKTVTEKYFKVKSGDKLFIGNKYVRVHLNQKKQVATVFLSNGIRVSLDIKIFHYVSDDPSKFDVRTVPRRDIKPPGAYIFRPIDPYIVRMDDEYEAAIVKTSIVEEIRMTYNSWSSMILRLYVNSPVIEVQWLVGPIPTEDGLGRDVFVRYTTDLDHDGAFYTDANGRQTIKRIRNARGTYEPVDLDPITGNLYPVTSKISIEDVTKNIRFSVFNDRCQAGGAVVDGAIDLMVHRRILTDDIGFGAYLNETESDGDGIRATGTHYLYITKADKNRVFEKKFAKEIAMAPRVLVSDKLAYTDTMKREFYSCKNEYSALNDRLPIGVHLLSFERIGDNELLVRLENYLEKADVKRDGVKYVALRNMFKDVRIIWLKETTLAANMYKDQWQPTQWKKKNKFFRSFNEYYGSDNVTYEEGIQEVTDELGGRGIRLAPQQIRTFIVRFEYIGPHAETTEEPK